MEAHFSGIDMGSVQNPDCFSDIGDYTTQLYEEYNK